MSNRNAPVCLTVHGNGAPVTSLSVINQMLSPVGARLWPLDLRQGDGETRQLLKQSALNEDEVTRVMRHYLLSRERLLEIVSAARRSPHIDGGGELTTVDTTHRVTYPELYQVEAGVDYSRFDRFHANLTDENTGVDEFMQVLAGSGVRFLQHLPQGGDFLLELGCPDLASGWVLSYDGAIPHIGSISGCSAGSKVLMQIIGPAHWSMRYEDET